MPDVKIKGPVPHRRFPEFRDEGSWEVKRLGEIGKIIKGKGISKSDISEDGALPCIRYGELYTYYSEVIQEIASFTDVNPDALVLSEENDVIIPASGETKEDIATASCVTVKGVALGGDLNIFRSPLNGIFLTYYVRGNLKAEISKVAQGDSVVHLYPTQLEKLKLAIPAEHAEQQRIADCLSSLDELIRAEEAQLAALKEHKKGLMQQLFPAQGETTPRLRFPEFRDAGPWEVKRLGEVCDMQAGNFIPASKIHPEQGQGLNPCYGGNGLRGFTESFTHIGSFPLIGRQGAYCGNVQLAEGKFHATEHAVVATPKESTTTKFLYFLLVRAELSRLATGQAQPGLSVTLLNGVTVPMPPEPEQRKIANCLSSLDDLIRAKAARIEALKTHKRGLMQQLFPSLDGVRG